MEAGFLNFYDEQFSDFTLSLDHQHNLLAESQNGLVEMVDGDFDYIQSLGLDSSEALWETEQELNGDLAVLPASGVSGAIPKMENIKEDFAKVLTDWQEHIGYLQASEIEEDIDIDMAIHHINPVDDIIANIPKDDETIISSPVKLEQQQNRSTDKLSSYKRLDPNCFGNNSISESDQSENEIDVVGLDSIEDVEPLIDYMHVRRPHATSPPKEYSSQLLGNNVIKIKQEPLPTFIKEEPLDIEDDFSPVDSPVVEKSESVETTKKKLNKKQKEEIPPTTSRKVKISDLKIPKKSKKDVQPEEFVQETSSSAHLSTSKIAPVLEAGDVTSLLEQFEATEAAANITQANEVTQSTQTSSNKVLSKSSVNKSQATLLKKSVDSQDSKLHQDIRDSLPKEVIDRIKASGRKKVISIIPAMPNTKNNSRNNGTRMQEAGATLSRNKMLKLVKINSNGRVDGSVQLDHDYCSNSNNSSTSSILSSSSNSSDCNSEYDRQISDSEQLTPVKGDCSKRKIDYQESVGQATCSGGIKRNWNDSGSKKDSGLESGDVSDASEEQQHQPSLKVKKLLLQDSTVNNDSKKIPTQISVLNKSTIITSTSTKPVYEMKIQSALATSILKLRSGVLTKTKSLETHKPKQQMVSVLKKPPVAGIPQKIIGNVKESIVTTTNSSNDQIQNIIVQDIEMPQETEKKPPRRKLNLAEYRTRRELNRSDGSRTNSPVQPMTLVYIHHVSTNTEPINDQSSPMWSEREIVSVLKPKVEVEEEKLKPKPATRDIGMQTVESVFGVCYDDEEAAEEEKKEEKEQQEQVQNIPEQGQQEKEKKNNVESVFVDVSIVKEEIELDDTMDGEIESGEITNDEITNNDLSNAIIENDTQLEKPEIFNDNGKALESASLNRIRDRKHRNYRRARASSSSSRSRSRSRSSRSVVHRSRSRSVSRSRGKTRSRSSSSSSRDSRSRSRSRTRRHTRRRRISHRRSSVSSTSSYSSRSKSRSRSRSSKYRSSRSRSRSSRSRSRSSRYSSDSRSSFRSNSGRSKWSSRRRKGKRDRRRSYDRRRRYSSGSTYGYHDYKRSPSYRRPHDEWYTKEKQRQVEERRVIYVGRLKDGIAKAELRKRFEAFGPVVDISIHFRERGHNYGFVTFAYKNDAYEAVEHGNDDPTLPRYDLCFGGRRAFCKVKYADLDGAADDSLDVDSRSVYKPEEENTFDMLLKEAQAKLRKRKV